MVGVVEEEEPLACVAVGTDLLVRHAQRIQLMHSIINRLDGKCQMAQAGCLGMAGTLRRGGKGEEFNHLVVA